VRHGAGKTSESDPWGAVAAASKRPIDVFALGEVSLDRVLEVDAFPPAGSKARLLSDVVRPGGQVATAALACARLGLRVAYATATGEDAAAERALAPLGRAGIDLGGVQRRGEWVTREAVVLVEAASGERSILERRDATTRLAIAGLDRKAIESARLLMVDATDPDAALWAARIARQAGGVVMLDADRPSPGLDSLLEAIDFPVVSRLLAEEIGSSSSVGSGLDALLERGSRVAVATLGELGALARSQGVRRGEVASPAFEIEARDTTGSGDAFHAGLAVGVLAGLRIEVALARANAVAALNCEAQGAQGGLPTVDELDRFLETARRRSWRDPQLAVGPGASLRTRGGA
jgi:sulfofructose kinase